MNQPKRLTRFARLLERRRLTTAAVAEAIGYSSQAVRAWRGGYRQPQRGAVAVLAQFLGVPVQKLRGAFSIDRENGNG